MFDLVLVVVIGLDPTVCLFNPIKVYHRILRGVNYTLAGLIMELEDLIFIIVAILIAVVLLKVFMWILPVIVVLLIAFFIYMYLKERYDY